MAKSGEREVRETLAEAAEIPAGFKVRSFGPVLSKPGDVVCGKYLGEGKAREVGRGRNKRNVTPYRVADRERGEVEVLPSAQIEQFFGSVTKGMEVFIRRDGQGTTQAGQKVNLYTFAAK